MKKVERIIRSWKDEEALGSLSTEEIAGLPINPAGMPEELTADALTDVSGGSTWACITTSSWVCGTIVTVSICDELVDYINDLEAPDEPLKLYCFAEGTAVRTPSGRQPIETFMPGDSVMAFDSAAGSVREARVQGLDSHQGSFPVLDLRAGGERVEVTPGHLFHNRDGWSYVERMGGQRCMDLREGAQTMHFAGARRTSKVYNLKVEGLASYYVGEADLLVRDH